MSSVGPRRSGPSGLLCWLQAEGLAAFALGLFVGRARSLWLLCLWFLRFFVPLDLALCHIVLHCRAERNLRPIRRCSR
jgi:hypothetical protein